MAKYQLPCAQLKVGDVCISLSHCKNEAISASIAAASAEMRPPPPPHELLERRRSNSASPSDKLMLKRAAASIANSPLAASMRPSRGYYSPTKQVMFADEVAPVVKKRKVIGENLTSTVTSNPASEAVLPDNAHKSK